MTTQDVMTSVDNSNSTSNSTDTNNHIKGSNNTNIIIGITIPIIGIVAIAVFSYYICSKIINSEKNKNFNFIGSSSNIALNNFALDDDSESDIVYDLRNEEFQKNDKITTVSSVFSNLKKNLGIQNSPTSISNTEDFEGIDSNSNKKNEYVNINYENIKREKESNKLKQIEENEMNRATLFTFSKKSSNDSNGSSNSIEVTLMQTAKKEKQKRVIVNQKENEEHKVIIANLIDALKERMNMKSGDKNVLQLPDCKNMTEGNIKRFKKYFSEDGNKFNSEELKKCLFSTKVEHCQDNNEIEKLFNDAYSNKTNKISKKKVEIVEDLHKMLFDKTNKWYETEIQKNNSEDKLLLALNKVKERLEERGAELEAKWRNMTQGSFATSKV